MVITNTVAPKNQFYGVVTAGMATDNSLKIGTGVLYLRNGQNGLQYEYDWANRIHSIGYLRRLGK